ncbi:MAG TPA: hypothetical protein VMH26_05965 [Burkholderiales bacterium]|nr:hypothetical protein [Burkholderiales bacterium]
MSETQSTAQPQTAQQQGPGFFVRELPYMILLALAVIGIVSTSVSPDASVVYWKVLAPVFAIVCIVTQWPRVPGGGGAKTRLVIVQLLHWGAFLLTVLILFLPDAQKMVNSLVSAQVVLYLLALSTFLAGLYNTSWQLVAVGVLMALAVPAIALLQQTVLLVAVIGAALAVVAGAFILHRRRGA